MATFGEIEEMAGTARPTGWRAWGEKVNNWQVLVNISHFTFLECGYTILGSILKINILQVEAAFWLRNAD